MHEFIRSPIAAVTWEIWHRNRNCVWLVVGITALALLLNLVLPGSFRGTEAGRNAIGALQLTLAILGFLPILALAGYTEFNSHKGSIGFPDRVFILPVTSLQLVAVPMLIGFVLAEAFYLTWVVLVFSPSVGPSTRMWFAVLIGTFMVLYQTILWTLANLGSVRMILVGIVAVIFIGFALLPSFPQESLEWWLSERFLTAMLIGLALTALLTSWLYVSHQRSGGGSRSRSLNTAIERVVHAYPMRNRRFASPADAQFWFEWRRAGLMLPLCVTVLLLVIVVPLSWHMRNESVNTLRILVVTVAMPVALALPIGKAFSKPDFWSGDLSLPAFVAVRPFTSEDWIIIKMKVAALSTVIAWLPVFVFLSIWFRFWANLQSVNLIRVVLWSFYDHTWYPQYVMAVLLMAAGMFLTWRFLVDGLWIGLSGNHRLFAVSTLPYGFTPILLLFGTLLIFRTNDSLLNWFRDNSRWLLPSAMWITLVAVLAKFWLAAFSWRKISRPRVHEYVAVWACGSASLVVLAMFLWAGLRYILPSDIYQLRTLLILTALLVFPLARLGMAPSSLARNRHR